MLPLETNLKEAYQKGTDDEQKFIQNLSLFLCTYLKEHGQLIERKQDMHSVLLEVKYRKCLFERRVDDKRLNKFFPHVLLFTLWFNMKEEFVDIDNPRQSFDYLKIGSVNGLCLLPNPIHMIVLNMDVP